MHLPPPSRTLHLLGVVTTALALTVAVGSCSSGSDRRDPSPGEAAAAVARAVESAVRAGDPSEPDRVDVEPQSYPCGGIDGLRDDQQAATVTARGPSALRADEVHDAVDAASDALVAEGWEVATADRFPGSEGLVRWLDGPDDATLSIEAHQGEPLVIEAQTGCFDV